MYSGILRSRTDACFATLLPIFEDVMESATFCHDRLEILSIDLTRQLETTIVSRSHICICMEQNNSRNITVLDCNYTQFSVRKAH